MKAHFYPTIIVALLVFIAHLCAPEAHAYLPIYTNQIQYQKSFTSGGVEYTMYWVDHSIGRNQTTSSENNYVKEIYIVPNAYLANGEVKSRVFKFGDGRYINPGSLPSLKTVAYHDVNPPFVGAVVKADIRKENNEDYGGYFSWEIKLPDDIAQSMMDLVKGRTKWRVPVGGKLDKIFGGANMIFKTDSSLQGLKYLD